MPILLQQSFRPRHGPRRTRGHSKRIHLCRSLCRTALFLLTNVLSCRRATHRLCRLGTQCLRSIQRTIKNLCARTAQLVYRRAARSTECSPYRFIIGLQHQQPVEITALQSQSEGTPVTIGQMSTTHMCLQPLGCMLLWMVIQCTREMSTCPSGSHKSMTIAIILYLGEIQNRTESSQWLPTPFTASEVTQMRLRSRR